VGAEFTEENSRIAHHHPLTTTMMDDSFLNTVVGDQNIELRTQRMVNDATSRVDTDPAKFITTSIRFLPPARGGKNGERNFVRNNSGSVTVFGDVTENDMRRAEKSAFRAGIKLTTEGKKLLDKVTAYCFIVLPKGAKDLRKQGKDEIKKKEGKASIGKEENINLTIVESSASDFVSAGNTAVTRELYRTTFLKYFASVLIASGKSPYPEDFGNEELRIVVGFLLNYKNAPRSRHLYLSHGWTFIGWMAPSIANNTGLQKEYSRCFKKLHGLVPAKDIEQGVRLEHLLVASCTLAEKDVSHNPMNHVKMKNLQNHLFARKYNMSIEKATKLRRQQAEAEFHTAVAGLMSGNTNSMNSVSSNTVKAGTTSQQAFLMEGNHQADIPSEDSSSSSSDSSDDSDVGSPIATPAAVKAKGAASTVSNVAVSTKAVSSQKASGSIRNTNAGKAKAQVAKAKSSVLVKRSEPYMTKGAGKVNSANTTQAANVGKFSQGSSGQSINPFSSVLPKGSAYAIPQPLNETNLMEWEYGSDSEDSMEIGGDVFCVGEQLLGYGASKLEFLGTMVRAWLLALRPEEWDRLVVEEIRGADRKTIMKFFMPFSKTDQYAEGCSWRMDCCCKEVTAGRSKSDELLSFAVPICPVHCTTEKAWEKVCKLEVDERNELFRLFAEDMGWERLLECLHKLHLLRVGAAQSMCDAGYDLEFLRVWGRWITYASPQLYKRDAERCPAMICLPRWPVAKSVIVGAQMSLDKLVANLSKFTHWKK